MSNKIKTFAKNHASEIIFTTAGVVVMVGMGATVRSYAAKNHRSYVRYLNQKGEIWTEGQNILIQELLNARK